MSKPKNRTKGAKARGDNGYPFDTGDWAKWSNQRRLDWMVNMRDKLRDKYKEKFNITDEQIEKLTAGIGEMEKAVAQDEFNAAQEAARNAKPPRESAILLGKLIDDICANDYYKARKIGFTDQQIDKMRADADKYIREIEEWERRENARNILGFAPAPKKPDDDTDDLTKLRAVMAFKDIDDTALKAAFASGDEEAVNREWDKWIAKLEAKAEEDPIFAKWFEDFRDDQEKLLRWDETIGDEDE